MWSTSGLMFSHKKAQKAHKEDYVLFLCAYVPFVAVI